VPETQHKKAQLIVIKNYLSVSFSQFKGLVIM